jgi:pimeloyl-ACP methyl ester carboxylesterase
MTPLALPGVVCRIRMRVPKRPLLCHRFVSSSAWDGLKHTHHFITATDSITSLPYKLHLYQIKSDREDGTNSAGPPCFLLHGGVENGKIFYSQSGKGFGPYLARLGYNVFIGDLRGKGMSTPSIRDDPHPNYGVFDVTGKTIPLFVNEIVKLTGQEKQCWISHSIGGVLMKSTLARHPSLSKHIQCEIHFGTKRTLTKNTLLTRLLLDVLYGKICQLIFDLHGYLPAKKYRIGSDDDTLRAYQTAYHWIHPKRQQWIDLEDGFSYADEYFRHFLCPSESNRTDHSPTIPPALVFTSSDDLLASPDDVKVWCREVGIPLSSVIELCAQGYSQKYNHFTMLTGASCEREHFQLVKDFLHTHFPSQAISYYSSIL